MAFPVLTAVGMTAPFADERAPVEGTWRLVSFERQYQASGEREYPMGAQPTGYILFLPEGRMAVVITADGRKAGNSEPERARLYDSLVAYTGRYRIEGDKWITTVDVSANPAWVGTDQVRTFRVAGDRLQEMTGWLVRPDARMARAVITYERVQVGAEKLKAMLLRPLAWTAHWSVAGDSGDSEIVFESRGDRVVAKIRNLTYPTTCEHDVAITPGVAKFDGCYDYDIALAVDPDDARYPLKGTSRKGYAYKVEPK